MTPQHPEREIERDNAWLVPPITIVCLFFVAAIFGDMVANWIASILLAFCVGALWGSGREMRRKATTSHKGESE